LVVVVLCLLELDFVFVGKLYTSCTTRQFEKKFLAKNTFPATALMFLNNQNVIGHHASSSKLRRSIFGEL
jgi:hypothetical protein